jgi:hypothetical protein
MNGISNDQDVMEYANNKATEEVLENTLQQDTKNFIHNYLINSFDWSDLAQEWRNHQFSYNEKPDASEKSKHAIWAKKCTEEIDKLIEPSKKFILQLNKLFSQDIDLKYINERIQAAFNYFLQPMDNLVYELLWKLEEVKRIKKVKAYYEELLVLEELQIKAVLRLMKAKLLIETIVNGETISKEKLTSDEIKYYRINKLKVISEEFKKVNVTLIEDEVDLDRYEKKKKTKEPKKSTYKITHELWLENKSIEEIAILRKFSTETIYGHFTKLIQEKTISIDAILPESDLINLAALFEGYNNESLTELKEKCGEKYSWSTLRMYKASL